MSDGANAQPDDKNQPDDKQVPVEHWNTDPPRPDTDRERGDVVPVDVEDATSEQLSEIAGGAEVDDGGTGSV